MLVKILDMGMMGAMVNRPCHAGSRTQRTATDRCGGRDNRRFGDELRGTGYILFRLLFITGLVCSVFAIAPGHASAGYASIVVDAKTGRVLESVNANTRNYPASLTKIMTLYLTFEALHEGKLSLDQKLPVSRLAAGRAPSKLGLRRGQTISVRDAITALVTKSANDVATVLAEAVGGTERNFARHMTAKARELGMKNTTFRNASGLPNRSQFSTAADMATLARAMLARFPKEYKYFSTRTFTWKGRTYYNHNKLLGKYAGLDGIKTGYIRASGFNLVASAKRNGTRIIAVMFGGKTWRQRNRQVARLMDRGFGTMAALDSVRDDKPVRVAAQNRPPEPARTAPPASLQREITQASYVPQPEEKPELHNDVTARETSRPEVEPALLKQIASNSPTAGIQAVASAVGITNDPSELNSWAIQVGAYNRFAPAHHAVTRAARAVPSLLGTRYAIVKQRSTRRRGPAIYKARLLVNSESKAHRSCRALKRRNIDCMVIWMGSSNS